jgi:hypothetical protein
LQTEILKSASGPFAGEPADGLFRHHHECQQSKLTLLNRPPQSLAEQDTNPVFDKQWPTPIAGERQFMHMPRFIKMTNLFSVRLTCVIGEVHPGIGPRKALLDKPAVAPGTRYPVPGECMIRIAGLSLLLNRLAPRKPQAPFKYRLEA